MPAVLLAAALVLIVIGAVVVTVSGEWWLTPQGANWEHIDAMVTATTVVTGVVFILINLVIAYAVFRYRAREGHRASSVYDNPRLEWTLIGLTTIGIILLLAPGLFVYGEVVAEPEDPMVVEVVASQWDWHYRYAGADGQLGASRDDLFHPAQNPMGVDPEDPAALDDRWVPGGPLVLPAERAVQLQLRSRDVIHIFFVPQFRVKQAAMPGMMNQLWFQASEVGEYQAVCTEFCGLVHHGMVGAVRIVEEDEFDDWLAERRTVGEVLGLVDETEAEDRVEEENPTEQEDPAPGQVEG